MSRTADRQLKVLAECDAASRRIAIQTYLEEKAENPREWLKREPRTTHPEILAIVRASDHLPTNDQVVARIAAVANVRDELHRQLGHEVYIARGILSDERAQAKLDALTAEGFKPLDAVTLVDGGRYVICSGTLYVGRSVASYGEPKPVRVKQVDERFFFMRKGARTRGFVPMNPMLVKDASAV